MTKLLINGGAKRYTTRYNVITHDARMGCFSNCLGVVTVCIVMRVSTITFTVSVLLFVNSIFQFVCFYISKSVCFNYFTLAKYEYVDVPHTGGTSLIHY